MRLFLWIINLRKAPRAIIYVDITNNDKSSFEPLVLRNPKAQNPIHIQLVSLSISIFNQNEKI